MTQQNNDNDRRRFLALDVLRGLAALGVVLWHWEHFFSGAADTLDRDRLPLSGLFAVFYRHGWLAVDLFFCLSGFIFFWLYARRVAAGDLGAARFGWLRLSRLYPLHLLTLLLVAAGQWWLMNDGATTFVYANNDAWHFALNLGMASSWGAEQGFSFNGPAWSISVEVLLYTSFFVCCRAAPLRWPVLLVTVVAGFAFASLVYPPIGRGVGCFFLGGLMWMAYERLRPRTRIWHSASGFAALIAWAITLWGVSARLNQHATFPFADAILHAWPLLVLFPLTILAVALHEARLSKWLRGLTPLGDVSYSLYLWHFPVQLGWFLLAGRHLAGTSIYYSPWFMAAFFAVLLTVSALSYYRFERPLQVWLRKRPGLMRVRPAC